MNPEDIEIGGRYVFTEFLPESPCGGEIWEILGAGDEEYHLGRLIRASHNDNTGPFHRGDCHTVGSENRVSLLSQLHNWRRVDNPFSTWVRNVRKEEAEQSFL